MRSKCIGLHVKYRLLLLCFDKTLILWTYSEKKPSNTKFHENLSSVSRTVRCGQADRHDEANSRFFATFGKPLKMYRMCGLCR